MLFLAKIYVVYGIIRTNRRFMQDKNMPRFGGHAQSMDMFRSARPNGYNQGPAMGNNAQPTPSFNFEPEFGHLCTRVHCFLQKKR